MKSYLKWVGGKAQLAEELIAQFPASFDRYLEAFCGSASLFFIYYGRQSSQDMFNEVSLPPAFLNDMNKMLVNCHDCVSRDTRSIIDELEKLVIEHKKNPTETYARVRKEVSSLFHPHPSGIERIDPSLSAAQFIYINKTCFNGLWRVNSNGGFNVPFNGRLEFGFSTSGITRAGQMLKKHATISREQFDVFIRKNATKSSFVFLDPPYIPLSATSSFTSYTQDGWTEKDDLRLKDTLEQLDAQGTKFMMTNSSSPKVYELFGKWNIGVIKAHRFVKAINCEDETRDKVDETIIRNY